MQCDQEGWQSWGWGSRVRDVKGDGVEEEIRLRLAWIELLWNLRALRQVWPGVDALADSHLMGRRGKVI